MTAQHLTIPVDAVAKNLLAEDGLRFATLDNTDRAAFGPWSQAISRSFHQGAEPEAKLDQLHRYYTAMRLCGVWDDTAAIPDMPIATTRGWPADLTVPGGSAVPTWAVSSVGVASTHRRRGIARALMEAELRTAAALDIPVAMLTVSESTIYGRFGYAPAAMARDLTIDTGRASWTGPEIPGRVQFVSQKELLVDGHAIIERARLQTPGQIEFSGVLWERLVGTLASEEDLRKLRLVRYDDENDDPQGFAIFTVADLSASYTQHVLRVHYLATATDDAYAGIWRFLLETDLVSKVTANLRPLDEPLCWMISDFRAVQTSDVDHLWIRILDVKRTLEARSYASPGQITMAISDPLGFAAGVWALDVSADGMATVTETSGPADVSTSVNALGSIYLGGVSATTLARAGQISGDASRLDAMFHSPVAPWLSIWF